MQGLRQDGLEDTGRGELRHARNVAPGHGTNKANSSFPGAPERVALSALPSVTSELISDF